MLFVSTNCAAAGGGAAETSDADDNDTAEDQGAEQEDNATAGANAGAGAGIGCLEALQSQCGGSYDNCDTCVGNAGPALVGAGVCGSAVVMGYKGAGCPRAGCENSFYASMTQGQTALAMSSSCQTTTA